MVRRRHGSDADQTRAELEKLIQEQTVLKVSYKGSISYRNAAKVQRKCRKKTEHADSSGESVAEQTKHANGDSAQSLTDQDECDDKVPGSPEQTPLSTSEKGDGVSGNSFVTCGASASRSIGASPRRDDGAAVASDASRAEGDEKEQKTCASVSGPSLRSKPSAPPNPKLNVESADLGDRLVAAVRSLSERQRGSAATRGHAPLGLKEILGYLSTPGEKLTRNRVKVVLEREIERGRLRRTRLGHIALLARGMGAAKASARLPKSALQDGHAAKKVT